MDNENNKDYMDSEEQLSREEELRRLERLYGPKAEGEAEETPADETVSKETELPEEESEIIVIETLVEHSETNPSGYESTAVSSSVNNTQSDEIDFLSKVITFFVNPFVIPAIATLLIFRLSILQLVADVITTGFVLIVAGATFLMPILLIFLLNRLRVVSSMSLRKRADRLCPYLFETIALGAISWFFAAKGSPEWVWLVFAGATAASLANMLINFKFKISSQATALAGMVALFLIIHDDGMVHENLMWWTIGTIILAGIAGTACIYTRRHNVWEILAGYTTGFLGVYLFSLIA